MNLSIHSAPEYPGCCHQYGLNRYQNRPLGKCTFRATGFHYVQADGSGREDAFTRKLRLIANGIKFHELEFDELQAACIGLTETMVPRVITGGYICPDHHRFWGWCVQVLLTAPIRNIVPTSGDLIHQLLESSACLILGGESYVLAPLDYKHSKDYDWCLERLISRKLFILKFLTYLLLESLLKAHCSSFVQADGTVTTQFSIQRRNGSNRLYNPGNRCSSLRDLFILLQQSSASPELLETLQRLESHFQRLDPTPFIDLLYEWRNATLHGTSEITAVSGTSFNLCLLLCLELVQPNYAGLQQAAVQNVVNWKAAKFNLSPIYYYDV